MLTLFAFNSFPSPAFAACTSPAGAPAKLLYHEDENTLMYCDGNSWIAMGPPNSGAGSSGCTNPARAEGTLLYNADAGVLQFCNGESWVAAASGSGGSSSPPAAPATGLVAHWKLEESSSPSVSEVGSFDMTWQGSPLTIGGVEGEALNFVNDTDFLSTPSDPALEGFSALTLSAWVFPVNSGASAGSRIISKTDGGTADDYALRHKGDNTVAFRLNPGSVEAVSTTQLEPNADWYHVVGVWDGSQARIYVDGVFEGAVAFSGPLQDSDLSLSIGCHFDSSVRDFAGYIDEVRIYDRALSSSEVATLHASSPLSGDTTTGLVARWRLNETSGPSISDVGSFDMTWAGSPASVSGHDEGAISFPTDSDYLYTSAASALEGFSRMTLSAWVHPTANGPSAGGRIVSKTAGGTADDYALRHNDDNTVTFRLNPGTAEAVSTTQLQPNSRWYHVAGVWDGAETRLYIDGLYEAKESSFTGPLQDSNLPLSIGRHFDSNVRDFTGHIDDVRIYDRALTTFDLLKVASACNEPYAPEGAVTFNAKFAGGSAPTSGLVGHWPLDETSGSSISDSAGANTGTWTDGANNDVTEEATDGVIAGALNFDGSSGDDQIIVSDYGITTELTISAWVNASLLPSNGGKIICKGFCDNTSTSNYRLNIYPDRVDFTVDSGGVKFTEWYTAFPTNSWHLVTGTYDGTVMRLYVDGEERATLDHGGSIDDHESIIRIGNSDDDVDITRAWHGALDDVRIYDRALSEAEIVTMVQPRGTMQYCNGAEWVAIGANTLQ